MSLASSTLRPALLRVCCAWFWASCDLPLNQLLVRSACSSTYASEQKPAGLMASCRMPQFWLSKVSCKVSWRGKRRLPRHSATADQAASYAALCTKQPAMGVRKPHWQLHQLSSHCAG